MNAQPAGIRQPWTVVRQAVLALLLILLPATAQAQTFPKFTNFVVDQADIIPAKMERQLDGKLADVQRRTRHQFAIATVSSLEGTPILEYSVQLARTWGVGRRHYDDGVLLLVAPVEHKVRIEVGYGLEATLTDARCAEIIRTLILPRFAQQDLAGGIAAGADAIIGRLRSAAPLERPNAS
ncbi:MAG TPA: TPM domain-containing protein [Sphingomonas sp.]|uniref:TPM domain-containing protein n=1 Tax=Sphingomonas sp. TaxID=28214 RepID=UPI002C08D730|nr:TPM domain-containing protein [Sphingomonas sp.]HMI18705.1 TPM domain-containing protein [Sphingomonas sp.]